VPIPKGSEIVTIRYSFPTPITIMESINDVLPTYFVPGPQIFNTRMLVVSYVCGPTILVKFVGQVAGIT